MSEQTARLGAEGLGVVGAVVVGAAVDHYLGTPGGHELLVTAANFAHQHGADILLKLPPALQAGLVAYTGFRGMMLVGRGTTPVGEKLQRANPISKAVYDKNNADWADATGDPR